MALQVGELYATLGIRDKGFKAGLAVAKTSMESLAASMTGMAAGTGALGIGLAGVAAALLGVDVKAVSVAADFEQTKMAFTTMLGSAEEADVFLQRLWDFAARTPFEFQGLADSTRKLLAFGFSAGEVIPMMTAIGDAVSGLGGSPEVLNRVTIAFGQIQAKGKVSAEEMMQLAEAGIPAWQMIADKIGTDVPTAMKKAEAGMIDARTAISALTEGLEKRFGGMMEKQSTTWNGLMSTMRDKLSAVFRDLGNILIPMLKPVLLSLGNSFALWPKYFAVVKRNIDILRPAFRDLIDALSPILPLLRSAGTLLFKGWVAKTKLVMEGIARGIKAISAGIKLMIEPMVIAMTMLASLVTQFMAVVDRLTGHRLGRLLGILTDVAEASVRASNALKPLRDLERAEAAAEAAAAKEQEAQAVLDVVAARRKDWEELRKTRAAMVGWTSVSEIWKSAMVAGQRSWFRQQGPPPLTAGSREMGSKELRAINDELKRQTAQQDLLLKTVKERLGTYAA